MQFDEALHYLLGLGHETLTIKLGLRNIQLILEALGSPQKSYPAVQIAGTNGKGSTAVVLDSICRTAGIKTGRYTSPHLVSIRERITIAGQQIPRNEFAYYATQVRDAAQILVNAKQIESLPTFFEHLTAMALLAFRDAGVEIAILETGLGGRLDATTAAAASTVAITPIGFDHEDYLGTTLESIAAEKAAIIRPGVVAIIAPQSEGVINVILQRCEASNVKPIINGCSEKIEGATTDGRLRVSFETDQSRYDSVLLGLRGRHQVPNTALAILLAESLRAAGYAISQRAIIEGIESVRHPGRLELHQGNPSLLFDGAHNPAGAQALRNYLDEFANGPVTLVFGAMRDKKLEEMATTLFPAANNLILTQTENARSATGEMLRRVAATILDTQEIILTTSVKEAIETARSVTPPEGVICFTGSLYLIGEVKTFLGESAAAEVAK
jgi:dihydrofolate synthase/folylpolyglutamate synthase